MNNEQFHKQIEALISNLKNLDRTVIEKLEVLGKVESRKLLKHMQDPWPVASGLSKRSFSAHVSLNSRRLEAVVDNSQDYTQFVHKKGQTQPLAPILWSDYTQTNLRRIVEDVKKAVKEALLQRTSLRQ